MEPQNQNPQQPIQGPAPLVNSTQPGFGIPQQAQPSFGMPQAQSPVGTPQPPSQFGSQQSGNPQQPQMAPPSSSAQKTGSYVLSLMLIGFITFLGGIGIGYALFGKKQTTKEVSKTTLYVTPTIALPTSTPSPMPTPTSVTFSWKTYTNPQYKFSIAYPSDWVAGEGAFAAGPGPVTANNTVVTVRVVKKDPTYVNNPLETYVRFNAGNETGPARTPVVITNVITESGLKGYKVEWKPSAYTANKITYTTFFEVPGDKTLTLQVNGMEGRRIEIYDEMIKTVRYVP